MKSLLFRLLLILGMWTSAALAQEEKLQGAQSPSQRPSEAAVVRKLSELQFHQGHILTCLASAHETGDSKLGAAVSLVKWDPGCVIPWHWHTPNENVLVVEGVLQQEWRDRESGTAKHGDFIHIPSHQVNQAKCISETPCMILLYSDAPMDIHFVDASGTEIPVGQAVAAETKVMEGLMKPTEVSSAEAELRAVMTELHRAALEGDTEKPVSLMTDEYVQTDISGHFQEKTEWLNTYSKPLAELIKAGKFRWEVYEEKDVQVRIYNDVAIVMGTLELKGAGARWGAQHTWVADPDAHPAATLRFTRVFIRRNGKWLLAAIHNALLPPPPPPAK